MHLEEAFGFKRVFHGDACGMTLDRMIDGLLDENLKKEFMMLYDFLVKSNN